MERQVAVNRIENHMESYIKPEPTIILAELGDIDNTVEFDNEDNENWAALTDPGMQGSRTVGQKEKHDSLSNGVTQSSKDRGRRGVQELAPPATCHLCHKIYKNKWSLTTHLRAKHKLVGQARARMPCLESGCGFKANRIARLITHLIQAHKLKFQCEKVTFRDKEDFWKWKKDAEERCQSTYSAPTSAKRTVSGDLKYFLRCSRSGYVKSRVGGGPAEEIGKGADIVKMKDCEENAGEGNERVGEYMDMMEKEWEEMNRGGKGWAGDGRVGNGVEAVRSTGWGNEVRGVVSWKGNGTKGWEKREEELKEWSRGGDRESSDATEKSKQEKDYGRDLKEKNRIGKDSNKKERGQGPRRACSGKINAMCTSFMVAVFPKEGGASVHFCRTHYGHRLENYQPRMTQEERNAIKDMISAGHSASDIMASLKVRLPSHRHHIVKYGNIHNIATRHNLHLTRGRDSDGSGQGMVDTKAILAGSDAMLEVEREMEVEKEIEVQEEVEVDGAIDEWVGSSESNLHIGENDAPHQITDDLVLTKFDKDIDIQMIHNSVNSSESPVSDLREQTLLKITRMSDLVAGLKSRSALMRVNKSLDGLLGSLESEVCIELVPDDVENKRTDIVLDRDVDGNDILMFCSDQSIDDIQAHESKDLLFKT